jgi:hypothetical protein
MCVDMQRRISRHAATNHMGCRLIVIVPMDVGQSFAVPGIDRVKRDRITCSGIDNNVERLFVSRSR